MEIAAACPGNFYARLERVLAGKWEGLARPFRDAFVTDWGRPTDPMVSLKSHLIGSFENITYGAGAAERIADSISLLCRSSVRLTRRCPVPRAGYAAGLVPARPAGGSLARPWRPALSAGRSSLAAGGGVTRERQVASHAVGGSLQCRSGQTNPRHSEPYLRYLADRSLP